MAAKKSEGFSIFGILTFCSSCETSVQIESLHIVAKARDLTCKLLKEKINDHQLRLELSVLTEVP
jgi:hypothetical protein